MVSPSQNIKAENGTPNSSARFHESSISVSRLKTAVWLFDIDNSRIQFANAAACALWQAESDTALYNRDLAKDMSPTVANRLKQYQSDFVESDVTFNEMWTLYPNGRPVSVMVLYSGSTLPDGRMGMLCEVVGRPDEEPENLRSAEALLHTDVIIALYEMDGPPVYLNPAARNSICHAMQNIAEMFCDQRDYAKVIAALQRSGDYRTVCSIKTRTGPRWHDLTVKKCSDAVTGNPALLVTAIDVSELKNARDKARYLADRDQLTGCYNRAFLQQFMANLPNYQDRRCALLCFDVDRFKQINDRHGHEMGDTILKEIAVRVKAAIRETDTFVRLGGDEFVIVIEEIPSDAEFAYRVDYLLDVISQPVSQDATKINVTVSMGIATFVPHSGDFTEVMRQADIALYAAKQSGRNRATMFTSEMGALATARDIIETELKLALENREFVLHFQPRLCLQSGQVVSAEALVRWQHPSRGLIMPGDFIPVCEETGMIEDLGQLVLEMGFTQILQWHESNLNIGLSLNISPRQFDDSRLLASLLSFSKHKSFPRDRIELEITESVLIGDHEAIEEKLEAISKMGYKIAIDDFGTGYSNLSYISRFPLDFLKIDQSFISQLPKSGPIISLILTLAKQIGATIVAEGVETQRQLDWLKDHSCDQVQGYLLSRPVAADKIQDVILHLNQVGRSR